MKSHRTGPPPSLFHYLLFHSLSRKNMCRAEGREEDQAACPDLEGRPATAASTGRRTRAGGLRGCYSRDRGALSAGRRSPYNPRTEALWPRVLWTHGRHDGQVRGETQRGPPQSPGSSVGFHLPGRVMTKRRNSFGSFLHGTARPPRPLSRVAQEPFRGI